MGLRELFLRPRTPAQQRVFVRGVVFAGAVAGILVVVAAAVVVFALFLGRYAV